MTRTTWYLLLIIVLLLLGYLFFLYYFKSPRGAYVVDAGNRPIEELQAGSSLFVGLRNLEPNTTYELRIGTTREEISSTRQAVSFARISTDSRGHIHPVLLWYHSGVVGCSRYLPPESQLGPYMYRTFEEAERDLAGRHLFVSAHPVARDDTGSKSPFELAVGESVSVIELPVAPRRSPMVYPSNSDGCLVNSQLAQSEDFYVSGRNFEPGEAVAISVVPNQRAWYVGDAINDATGVGGAGAPERVRADEQGRFTLRVWDDTLQRRGVYDIIAQRRLGEAQQRRVRAEDIISYAADTGMILFLRYPVGGPTMDLAGRPISGSPYFQFADSFAESGDTVWGAVDPTYVPDGHSGGKYAAYYVVNHRDVNGWDPSAGGSISLMDISGGIEVMPVKAGCINGTDTPIWYPPLTLGDYDVVVDFGASPAENATDYMTDSQYNDTVDFLDGADQIGFIVAKDPYELGPHPIGRAEYSQDDYFTTLGAASNVDLRAVVRYPATAAGNDTTVAPGQHPMFFIQHGNHKICEVSGTHASCPDRTPNHEGYMRLLEILASHGIIAVSIDAYDLTGLVPQWIAERGTLILKHIELWSHMNDASTFTTYPDFFAGRFNNHIDMSKISVSGHSRGGEASVAAYMLNTTFSIGSVSSIAPVDGQSYILPDVPYFVILPAADGDVSNLSGVRIYDRSGGSTTPIESTTKSGIYLYGANHNFFNTVWADDGDDYVIWVASSRDDYIDKVDQQRLGEAYLAAFVRTYLGNEVVYEDMFRGRLIFPSTAGFKNFHFRHENNHSKLENGSGNGVVGGGATATTISGPSVHTTQAQRVSWSSSAATLTFSIPTGQQNASSFEILSFRVAQTNSSSNPATGDQDFQVELIGGGKVKATYASRFDRIPKPYNHGYGPRNVMTTVRIPLHSFIMNKSGVTLDNIDTVRLRFTNPSQGEIYVDDIEFSR